MVKKASSAKHETTLSLSSATSVSSQEIEELYDRLASIWLRMEALESRFASELAEAREEYRNSLRNLLHYMALRQEDIRHLQPKLSALGLSSLGRTEVHTMNNLEMVLHLLNRLLPQPRKLVPGNAPVSFDEGQQLLDDHTTNLLGTSPENHPVRIMVTMPSEAASQYTLVRDLIAAGMNVMRINCAHDDAATWEKMIAHLRQAERELSAHCKIFMDLAGPKIRTGPIDPGPAVLRWRPQKDAYGRILAPARIWLYPREGGSPATEESDAQLGVEKSWLEGLKEGMVVKFNDLRGKTRRMQIVAKEELGALAESNDSSYLGPNTELSYLNKKVSVNSHVYHLPTQEQTLLLKKDDILLLTKASTPGLNAIPSKHGNTKQPAQISCTAPQIFTDVKAGERIWFDDGKIAGKVLATAPEFIRIKITHARPMGSRLAADKGINLPDSTLSTPSLTPKDLEDLKFIVKNADLVGYSFVRTSEDVLALHRALEDLQAHQLGVILKIETRTAFENLPRLLMTGMRYAHMGVMIARGDLAIECGYERMAEIQEQILWVCEAAHVPVVWATQVLENLAKTGQPSRAEITDAAMGVRAECVMLNKGPYIIQAVKTLDDILRRMSYHQDKKRNMLRQLRLSALS